MGKFLTSEKPKQTDFKMKSSFFSTEAKQDGIYKDHPYSFCLPRQYAHENLFPEIRETILAYFAQNKIKWHDGQDGKPSNHMCSSQVCCANFLYPFSDKPEALAALLQPIYPRIDKMLQMEDGQYVSFEWIGEKNYLNEVKSTNCERTRGANFTSADAAVMFQHENGQKQIVLIEWKYTESYSSVPLEIAQSGTRRTEIYQNLFDKDDCPLDKQLLPIYQALFYEPFYQLMRQQFLANEMEKAHELGANKVSLLHISPAHNSDFKFVTSPKLVSIGNTPINIWERIILDKSNFNGVSTEFLFGNFNTCEFPELHEWKDYITTRYKWVIEK